MKRKEKKRKELFVLGPVRERYWLLSKNLITRAVPEWARMSLTKKKPTTRVVYTLARVRAKPFRL